MSSIEGDALTAGWLEGQNAILISYRFSGVPGAIHADLLSRADVQLATGGHFLVHGFMVHTDRSGPWAVALW
ncbi:hypothetical protein [Salipiger pallidus]|nr:hypothetical protein [Salipiger pallidus]